MKKTVYICDLCNAQFNYKRDTMILVNWPAPGQYVITKSGNHYDLCAECCKRLYEADNLSIAKLNWDIDAMFKTQGWVKSERGWTNGWTEYIGRLAKDENC